MSERPLDLRYVLSTLRRHRRLLACAALLGAMAGAALVLLRPPLYTSTSVVLLPSAFSFSGETTARDVETQVRIARSHAVLDPAGQALRPSMSVRALNRNVTVTAPTPDVLEIVAEAVTPERARAISRAVTDAQVDYMSSSVSSLSNAQRAALTTRESELTSTLDAVRDEIESAADRRRSGTSARDDADATVLAQLTAQEATLILQLDEVKDRLAGIEPRAAATVIQEASPAERPTLVTWFTWAVLIGAVALTALASMALTVAGVRDRRLRYRDDLADALGRPVLASVRSRSARSAAGWVSLLSGHDPGPTEVWAFRQALHQITLHDPLRAGHPAARGSKPRRPLVLTVISFSGDSRGLAVGPQLATYAASTGLRTRLVTAQGDDSSAPLWAACARMEGQAVRPGLSVDSQVRPRTEADLTIAIAVTDRREPSLPVLPDEAVAVLAVSSGSATADELARAAVSLDDAGLRILGMIVADPDVTDRTTGRLLQPERAQEVSLPTRLTGVGVHAPAASTRRRQG